LKTSRIEENERKTETILPPRKLEGKNRYEKTGLPTLRLQRRNENEKAETKVAALLGVSSLKAVLKIKEEAGSVETTEADTEEAAGSLGQKEPVQSRKKRSLGNCPNRTVRGPTRQGG